jgi:2-polyprenyl-3-methyl-5-hydroxy-6-metoxy-1,4-benzoquinol methylase
MDERFYDALAYGRDFHCSRHFTESPYYFLWTVITDRILRAKASCVLDIGCGTGQLGGMLAEHGVHRYVGFDFSSERIQIARKLWPFLEFHVADAYNTSLVKEVPYDCVVCTEFLEHVSDDLGVLQRLRPGTLVLATVPNFDSAAHVRVFENANEVKARYEQVLRAVEVSWFHSGMRVGVDSLDFNTFYLMQACSREI